MKSRVAMAKVRAVVEAVAKVGRTVVKVVR
jgi:hypothetical protein